MSLKNNLKILYMKYKSIISLKEFIEFTKQLDKVEYRLIIKRQLNNIKFNYEKSSVLDLFRRAFNYFQNKKSELYNYQKIIYKI